MLAPGSEEPRLLRGKKSPTDEEAFATSILDGCEVSAPVRQHTLDHTRGPVWTGKHH